MSSVTPAVSFRALMRADYPLLARWFSEPDVSRWWNEDPSFDAMEEKYGPRIDGEDETTMWVVEIDGDPAGLMQHYRHGDYVDHDVAVGIADAVGIDFLLSDEFAGRGLGPTVLSRFSDLVLELTSEATCCVATPAQENRRSWRALEKASFERRGPCRPPNEPVAWVYVRPRRG